MQLCTKQKKKKNKEKQEEKKRQKRTKSEKEKLSKPTQQLNIVYCRNGVKFCDPLSDSVRVRARLLYDRKTCPIYLLNKFSMLFPASLQAPVCLLLLQFYFYTFSFLFKITSHIQKIIASVKNIFLSQFVKTSHCEHICPFKR